MRITPILERLNSEKTIIKGAQNLVANNKVSESITHTADKPLTSYAVASIEINKKKYIAPKTINNALSQFNTDDLDSIIPDMPKLSDLDMQQLKNKIRTDKRILEIIPTLTDSKINIEELTGQYRLQLANKFLKNYNLFNNEETRKEAIKLAFNTAGKKEYTPKQAKVANFVLSSSRFYGNPKAMHDSRHAIIHIDDFNINFALKILCDKRFDKTNTKKYLNLILWRKQRTKNPEKAIQTSIQVLEKYLNTPELNNNKSINENFDFIMSRTTKDLEYVNKLFDKYTSSPELKDCLKNIIGRVAALDVNNYNFDLLERILNNPILYNNKAMYNGSGIDCICHSFSEERVKRMIKILDTYLSNEKFYKNSNINEQLSSILLASNREGEPLKIKLMDKYIKSNMSQELYTPNVIGHLLWECDSEHSYKFIDKYLSNEKLRNNKNWMNEFGYIARELATPKEAELIDKLCSKDEVVADKEITGSISRILNRINWTRKSPANSRDIRLQILEKIIDKKELYMNKNLMLELPNFMHWVIGQKQYDFISTVLDNKNLYNNNEVLTNLTKWVEESRHFPTDYTYQKIKNAITAFQSQVKQ